MGAGEGAALIAALESGQVDAFLTAVPVPGEAVARGKPIMFINPTGGMGRKAVQTLIEMTQSNVNVDEFDTLFYGRFLKD